MAALASDRAMAVPYPAAGFLAALDLPVDDPAARVWARHLEECSASGVTPGQVLEALRAFPDDGASDRLTGPLGQGSTSAGSSR